MRTKIKICGLKTSQDISFANRLHPDYIGFIFVPESRRFVDVNTALTLRRELDPEIRSVGVFVNAPVETVLSLADQALFSLIQLHGQENEAYVQKLKASCDLPVIKAFSVSSSQDVENALAFPSDYLLFDHGKGGTGQAFDWSLLQKTDRPVFLAGGLNPENVTDAITLTKPYAVDTSSGVETDHQKDFNKMKQFIQAVRDL